MNKSPAKNVVIFGLLIIITGLIWFGFFSDKSNKKQILATQDNQISTSTDNLDTDTQMMELVVYVQDKEMARTSDCGITLPKTIQVPKTVAVADASLDYLFKNELAKYAKYQSVVIEGGVAKITLETENDPTGLKISALSSCEARHLFSVLKDTLTQYDTIDSVELYSPSGKIEF